MTTTVEETKRPTKARASRATRASATTADPAITSPTPAAADPAPATPTTPPAGDDSTTGEVELRGLVWDREFAGTTGGAVVSLLIAVGVVCMVAASRFIGDDATSSDVTSLVVIVGLLLGAVMIACGAWVLLLEMRGRAPEMSDKKDSPTALTAVGEKQVRAATDYVKALGRLRGGIALVLAGAALVGGMAWIANDAAPDGGTTSGTTSSSSR